MAGKYYTATVAQDYLHDVKGTGTAPSLTSTEKDRAETFASAWVDQAFYDYERTGWDETAGNTAPPVIKEIAAAIAGSVVHRILGVRDSYAEAEDDSAATRLLNYARMLAFEILDGNGIVVTSSGTEQLPKQGRGKTGTLVVGIATCDAVVSDRILNRFAIDVVREQIQFDEIAFDYSTYFAFN